jgi:lysophospholipase L1-like esterase
VYGGSTTFGYGVPDDHTIPSYLQQQMEQKSPGRAILVKNFGQGFYYSSQEQQLLFRALKSGDVPDWAIFIDGGNDVAQLALRHDEPIFTPAMKRAWSTVSSGGQRANLNWIPMVRLVDALARRLRPAQGNSADSPQHQLIKSDAHLSAQEKNAIQQFIIARYTRNMRIVRAVCREFGVRCLFVWQPHPAFKYDRTLHRTFPFDGPVPAHHGRVYAHMQTLASADFLFLGDLTEKATRKVYVDDVHYNEDMNEQIAIRISEAILER